MSALRAATSAPSQDCSITMTTPQRLALLSAGHAFSSVIKEPKMLIVIYRRRVQTVQKANLPQADIMSKGRRNVARAPQAPMLCQGQHQPTASRVPWVELTTTTTSGLRAKSAVQGPSRQTTRTNWSRRMLHHARVVLLERLMATRTLAAHALYVQSARRIQ